jgi:hypothetical protein
LINTDEVSRHIGSEMDYLEDNERADISIENEADVLLQ